MLLLICNYCHSTPNCRTCQQDFKIFFQKKKKMLTPPGNGGVSGGEGPSFSGVPDRALAAQGQNRLLHRHGTVRPHGDRHIIPDKAEEFITEGVNDRHRDVLQPDVREDGPRRGQ